MWTRPPPPLWPPYLGRISLGLFYFSSYRQDPVDGQIQHLADAQQVYEAPEDGRDERGNHDEQEPVGSAEQGR